MQIFQDNLIMNKTFVNLCNLAVFVLGNVTKPSFLNVILSILLILYYLYCTSVEAFISLTKGYTFS